MLSDRDIRRLIKTGELVVKRGDGGELLDVQFQSCSIDVYLGKTFARPLVEPFEADWVDLAPGAFILATTDEWNELPLDLAARIEGVSSQARSGLVNQIAPLIPPGFKGNITLEVFNASSETVRLTPGDKIGQIIFERLSSPVLRPYGHPELKSKYQGQRGATLRRAEPLEQEE